MNNSPKKSKVQWLQEELDTEAEDRLKTQEALAKVMAENMYLRSVVAGISPRPIREVLRSGKSHINAIYRLIVENGYEYLYRSNNYQR